MHFKSGKSQSGFGHFLMLLGLVLLAVAIGFAGWRVFNNKKSGASLPTVSSSGATVIYDRQASQQLTNGQCKAAGSVSVGPPMPLSQTSFILPYGLVIGGHVTPVDHQYYNGLDTRALRDTYDVIAPADGAIVQIQHRGSKTNTPPHTVDQPSSDEYRIIMAHTCSFLTYVDLVTSLSDQVKAGLPANWDPTKGFGGSIPITKGEVIGHIGGQTLDFAVWDLSKPLKGFITPSNYTAESWKQFTAPTSNYLDPSIKAQVIAKYVRTAAPIDGKIDYDIDGKAIGNWFMQGTGGYSGNAAPGTSGYWAGHLSIAPDFIDPSVFNISIGNYDSYPKPAGYNNTATGDGSGAAQFMTKANSPDPATVGQSTGLVKYELVSKQYVTPSGQNWDNSSLVLNVKAVGNSSVSGTALLQLTGTRTLKFEVFPGLTADQASGFDSGAKTYTR